MKEDIVVSCDADADAARFEEAWRELEKYWYCGVTAVAPLRLESSIRPRGSGLDVFLVCGDASCAYGPEVRCVLFLA